MWHCCSNRSIAHLRMGNAKKALQDAEEALKLKPDWDKAYSPFQIGCGSFNDLLLQLLLQLVLCHQCWAH